MRFFVAGIVLDPALSKTKPLNVCANFVTMIPTVMNDAKNALGDDVIVIIALEEYAFTPEAITHFEKDQILEMVKKAIEPYDNLLIIPGSFSEHQLLSEAPHKFEKIKNNYEIITQQDFMYRESSDSEDNLEYLDGQIDDEYDNFLEKANDPIYEIRYLQHKAYSLTNQTINSHSKLYPCNERDYLSGYYKNQCVFFPGKDNPIRTVTINGKKITYNTIICRDHHHYLRMIPNQYSLLEITISAFLNRKEDNTEDFFNVKQLKGAVSINMDSKHGLNVYVNRYHPLASQIKKVYAREYTKYKDRVESMNIDITRFRHLIDDNNMLELKPSS